MKYLKIAFGLALVAGLMAVAASPAMATARWVTCVKGSGPFSTNQCTTTGSGGWETKELAGTSTVTSSGELELEDAKATGGATGIICKGSGTGWVANLSTGNGEDGVTKITATSCKFLSGKVGACEESKGVTAKARNLPWGTKLVENGKKEVRDEIVSGAKKEEGEGEPGWSVECTVGGILKITDTCEHSGNTVSTHANRSTGELEESFDEITKAETMAKCSVGGAEAGLVRGTLANKLSSGAALWILSPELGT
jgi:hypothetical protein